MGKGYHCVMGDDDIPLIVRGVMGQNIEAEIGRAVSMKDGNLIANELNRLIGKTNGLRDKLIAEVDDVIENAFGGE